MITRQEYSKHVAGSRYDSAAKAYVAYKINVRVGGKRYRTGTFPTRKAAQEYVDSLKQKHSYKSAGLKAVAESPRLSVLFAKRKEQITERAERIRSDRVFGKFIDLAGDVKVTDVRTSHFQNFINSRSGVKLETVNREMNILSAAFRRAPEMFPNELEDYEPPKVARPKFKAARRERVVTEKEKAAILKYLYAPQTETDAVYKNRVRIGRMFEIAFLLGLRYSEVAGLLKTDYNGESLRVFRPKTVTVTLFEFLPAEAHKVLSDAIEASDTDFIFTHTGSTPKNFYPEMQKAVEEAGLPYGRGGITFHSARHSFVTSAMRHTDLATVASMSGHSDSTMVMLYSHASPESRKRALQSMYGGKDLREIYEKVRTGEMDFAEFEKLLS